jgi:hypothetical protein
MGVHAVGVRTGRSAVGKNFAIYHGKSEISSSKYILSIEIIILIVIRTKINSKKIKNNEIKNKFFRNFRYIAVIARDRNFFLPKLKTLRRRRVSAGGAVETTLRSDVRDGQGGRGGGGIWG